jgi:hypothetical protein
MNRLVVVPFAVPFACLACLSLIAIVTVVALAAAIPRSMRSAPSN